MLTRRGVGTVARVGAVIVVTAVALTVVLSLTGGDGGGEPDPERTPPGSDAEVPIRVDPGLGDLQAAIAAHEALVPRLCELLPEPLVAALAPVAAVEASVDFIARRCTWPLGEDGHVLEVAVGTDPEILDPDLPPPGAGMGDTGESGQTGGADPQALDRPLGAQAPWGVAALVRVGDGFAVAQVHGPDALPVERASLDPLVAAAAELLAAA